MTIHVKPNARATRIVSWLDDTTVKVEVTAPPEKGKANEAVLRLLSDELGIPRSSIELVRGASTRMKQVRLPEGTKKRPD
ncbi:hypothetical protein A2856_00910 [Candidatus Uhrbacteria bacterium RIFCSPHIGHO2_01_FULL_63_20]|uniref:UPF0235 protein A2856_00910 n=1 Tax=Candidatus Uhrbacteria bacterium RIFCSPHIGHO2_01_FULL_63_20 TaxID=1802385 RepID=A0A1F7TM54_9BACT|nr:MAG: hypothetical protein A2856_00910 [Candidatus Uhrbacteria bacterium RIFCSPHIGHO2_01_FULL_63_20]